MADTPRSSFCIYLHQHETAISSALTALFFVCRLCIQSTLHYPEDPCFAFLGGRFVFHSEPVFRRNETSWIKISSSKAVFFSLFILSPKRCRVCDCTRSCTKFCGLYDSCSCMNKVKEVIMNLARRRDGSMVQNAQYGLH